MGVNSPSLFNHQFNSVAILVSVEKKGMLLADDGKASLSDTCFKLAKIVKIHEKRLHLRYQTHF